MNEKSNDIVFRKVDCPFSPSFTPPPPYSPPPPPSTMCETEKLYKILCFKLHPNPHTINMREYSLKQKVFRIEYFFHTTPLQYFDAEKSPPPQSQKKIKEN